MAFNPIGQLSANGQASSQYVWSGQPTTTANFTHDHLNRDAAMAAASGYDANGNLVSDGTRTFTYDPENRLTGVTGGSAAVSLSYDPFGRLYQYTAGGASIYFSYLGSRMAGELTYNGSSYTAVRDYAYDGAQPFLWPNSFWAIWGGSGGGDFRFLQQDRLGSVIATSTMAGTVTPYAYGPYGEPQSWSGSRFRYTGQIALPEAQLYHYNARAYDPMLGRFLQTDPIRYGDGGNIYAYVHGDPVNGTDPSGTTIVNGYGEDLSPNGECPTCFTLTAGPRSCSYGWTCYDASNLPGMFPGVRSPVTGNESAASASAEAIFSGNHHVCKAGEVGPTEVAESISNGVGTAGTLNDIKNSSIAALIGNSKVLSEKFGQYAKFTGNLFLTGTEAGRVAAEVAAGKNVDVALAGAFGRVGVTIAAAVVGSGVGQAAIAIYFPELLPIPGVAEFATGSGAAVGAFVADKLGLGEELGVAFEKKVADCD